MFVVVVRVEKPSELPVGAKVAFDENANKRVVVLEDDKPDGDENAITWQ